MSWDIDTVRPTPSRSLLLDISETQACYDVLGKSISRRLCKLALHVIPDKPASARLLKESQKQI